jgi:hypothetical protein
MHSPLTHSPFVVALQVDRMQRELMTQAEKEKQELLDAQLQVP